MNYREKKAFLKKQLADYEKGNPMTKKERRELREWVKLGNSPYDNPLSFIEEHYMQEMDFLAFQRAEPEEKGLTLDGEIDEEESNEIGADDLPF